MRLDDWPAEERALWAAEMDRSTREYYESYGSPAYAAGRYCAARGRSRTLVAASRRLVREARALRQETLELTRGVSRASRRAP